MFCIKCGKEIPNDSVFCEFCGERQPKLDKEQQQIAPEEKAEKPIPEAPAAESGQAMPAVTQPEGKKKSKKKIAIIVAICAVVVIGVFAVIELSKPTVDVMESVNIPSYAFTGYNGYAKLNTYSISSGLTSSTLPDGIENNTENRTNWTSLVYYLHYTADKTLSLKNGDTITVTSSTTNEQQIKKLASQLGIRVKNLGGTKDIKISTIKERYSSASEVAGQTAMLKKIRESAQPLVKSYIARKVPCTVSSISLSDTYFLKSSTKVTSYTSTPNDVLAVFYKVKVKYNGSTLKGNGVVYVQDFNTQVTSANVMGKAKYSYFIGGSMSTFAGAKKEMQRQSSSRGYTWSKVK